MLYAIILFLALAVVVLGSLNVRRSTASERVAGSFARAGRGLGSLEMNRQGFHAALPLR